LLSSGLVRANQALPVEHPVARLRKTLPGHHARSGRKIEYAPHRAF